MNKRRKEALQNRAQAYGNRRMDGVELIPNIRANEIALGFEAGYRSAMKDARKAAESQRNQRTFALTEWLRPLR